MPQFKSNREKRLWVYSFLVISGIFLGLFTNRPLQRFFSSQDVQFVFFLSGLILTVIAIVIHGIKLKPGKIELAVWIGMAAFFLMFFFRLGAPERSHMIEYALLSILIHRALCERKPSRGIVWNGLIAFVTVTIIGAIDELVQILIPYRVFDTEDILFNMLITLMTIAGAIILHLVSKKLRNRSS